MNIASNKVEVFAILLDGEVVSQKVIKKHFPSYGQNELYGWRPPKRVYYKLGHARAGLKHLPEQIQKKVKIHKFVDAGPIE